MEYKIELYNGKEEITSQLSQAGRDLLVTYVRHIPQIGSKIRVPLEILPSSNREWVGDYEVFEVIHQIKFREPTGLGFRGQRTLVKARKT